MTNRKAAQRVSELLMLVYDKDTFEQIVSCLDAAEQRGFVRGVEAARDVVAGELFPADEFVHRFTLVQKMLDALTALAEKGDV